VSDEGHHEPEWLDEWFDGESDDEHDDASGPPRWRRPLLIGVAVLTAFAVAAVPLWNLLRPTEVSDSGLELCQFDYCVVQERIADAGLLPVMNRLSTTFLEGEEAAALADDLVSFLGVPPVELVVVERLEGQLGGVYQPSSRTILVRRPVRAWIVLHEVAHTVSLGHGADFVDTLADLARWIDAKP
jgi:hypothetical protein